MLSYVSSVFDPMGVFAPFTMRRRMLLKSIWIRFGQSWDENVADDDKQVILDWVKAMQINENTSLPRKYLSDNPKNVQLHIFSDASLEAMCIVAYFRVDVNDGVEISFVLGYCRIDPIKQLSKPRLELQAAVCSVRLRTLIVYRLTVLLIGLIQLLCFKGYIRLTRNQKPNRAAEILQTSTNDKWNHVRGELNYQILEHVEL